MLKKASTRVERSKKIRSLLDRLKISCSMQQAWSSTHRLETGIKILCKAQGTGQPIYMGISWIGASIDPIKLIERYSRSIVPEEARQQYALSERIAYHGEQVTDIESMVYTAFTDPPPSYGRLCLLSKDCHAGRSVSAS